MLFLDSALALLRSAIIPKNESLR